MPNMPAGPKRLRASSRNELTKETLVPIHLNVHDVAPETTAPGVQSRSLLSSKTVPDIKFQLDCIGLAVRTAFDLAVAANDLAWFQVLEGEIALAHAGREQRLTEAHVVFLPPGFRGSVRTEAGASLLLALVPKAAELDPEFTAHPPGFRVVDWRNEPLLESKHDARKRIYLVTPALFGTKAIKGEMIIYPPRTEAPNHFHVGAAHFMYFLKGGGTAFANEQPFAVKSGDVVYYLDQERHALRSGDDQDMVFSEFFVPGEVKTVWVRPEIACTWVPTGKNIAGGKPSRDIKEHSFANPVAPTDV
jgi:quercetin dioxygenase-like cupin family protein